MPRDRLLRRPRRARATIALVTLLVALASPAFAGDEEIFSSQFELGEDPELCEWSAASTPELCNGEDEDCDLEIDEDPLPAESPPACATQGVCAGESIPVACAGALGWRCDYTDVPNVELDAFGQLVEDEFVCNLLDGNCNGVADDGVEPPFYTCTSLGACQGHTFEQVCTGINTWTCLYSGVPALDVDAEAHLLAQEVRCDSIDNNCNGVIDLDGFPTLGQPCGSSGGHYVCHVLQFTVTCSSP